jgi:undecaprenyl diphosphate synthase
MQNKPQNGLHVAIIMDGNGRWATARGLPRIAGHRAGVAAVRRTVEHAPDAGIATLTVYAFSADNWRRPPREVHGVLSLIAAYLRIETERLRRSGVRLEVIGRRDRLPRFLVREIEKAEWAIVA